MVKYKKPKIKVKKIELNSFLSNSRIGDSFDALTKSPLLSYGGTTGGTTAGMGGPTFGST